MGDRLSAYHHVWVSLIIVLAFICNVTDFAVSSSIENMVDVLLFPGKMDTRGSRSNRPFVLRLRQVYRYGS